jgi:hypothetical protein
MGPGHFPQASGTSGPSQNKTCQHHQRGYARNLNLNETQININGTHCRKSDASLKKTRRVQTNDTQIGETRLDEMKSTPNTENLEITSTTFRPRNAGMESCTPLLPVPGVTRSVMSFLGLLGVGGGSPLISLSVTTTTG